MGSWNGRVALTTGASAARGLGAVSTSVDRVRCSVVRHRHRSGHRRGDGGFNRRKFGATTCGPDVRMSPTRAGGRAELTKTEKREVELPITMLHKNTSPTTTGDLVETDVDPVKLHLAVRESQPADLSDGHSPRCKDVLAEVFEIAASRQRLAHVIHARRDRGCRKDQLHRRRGRRTGPNPNCCCPVGTRGTRCDAIVPDGASQRDEIAMERVHGVEASHLLNRLGRAAELANVATFLASDLAGLITRRHHSRRWWLDRLPRGSRLSAALHRHQGRNERPSSASARTPCWRPTSGPTDLG